ncbi:hypothetical protein E2P81_ATG02360 [Venturia nashicola]|nr:hypothetical protein E2P81_ATG02360 [Venturia nashicola]
MLCVYAIREGSSIGHTDISMLWVDWHAVMKRRTIPMDAHEICLQNPETFSPLNLSFLKFEISLITQLARETFDYADGEVPYEVAVKFHWTLTHTIADVLHNDRCHYTRPKRRTTFCAPRTPLTPQVHSLDDFFKETMPIYQTTETDTVEKSMAVEDKVMEARGG